MPQQLGALEVRHRRLLDHRAVAKDRHAVGRLQGELDIVRDEQDAAALAREGAQVVQGAHRKVEVEARRGLVGHDQPGIVHKRAHEEHAASHTARKLIGKEPLDRVIEPVGAEELALARTPALRVRPALGPRSPPRRTAHLLAHAHERVQVLHALGVHRNAVSPQAGERVLVQGLAVKPDAARHLRVGLEATHDAVGEHRLAGTARAHHGQDLALVHGKGQVAHHLLPHARCREERRGGVVHVEADGQPLHREQVVRAGMVRFRGMAVAVVELAVAMAVLRAMQISFACHIACHPRRRRTGGEHI